MAQGFSPAKAQAPRNAITPLPSFAEPGISPDGATIAFVSGGDIWEVPARGGDARLLVSHPATESRPLFAPDGKRLAFTSTRTGNGDIYVLSIATGERDAPHLRRCGGAGHGMVGRRQVDLFLVEQPRDLGMTRRVSASPADGGTPMPVAADRYTTEYFAAPAPAGDAVAITARANAGSQWWRKGHSHLDESEIWLVGQQRRQALRCRCRVPGQVTQRRREGRVADVERATARRCYFMSDRSGAQNIWSISGAWCQVRGPVPRAGRKALTTFKDGRVLWPSISKDGKTIAFERDFGIWTVDTASGQAREVSIALRGAPAAAAIEHRSLQRSDPGARALAGRQEDRVHGPRRDLLGVGEGRRRRVRMTTTRERRSRIGVGAGQPPPGVRVRLATARIISFIYDFGAARRRR